MQPERLAGKARIPGPDARRTGAFGASLVLHGTAVAAAVLLIQTAITPPFLPDEMIAMVFEQPRSQPAPAPSPTPSPAPELAPAPPPLGQPEPAPPQATPRPPSPIVAQPAPAPLQALQMPPEPQPLPAPIPPSPKPARQSPARQPPSRHPDVRHAVPRHVPARGRPAAVPNPSLIPRAQTPAVPQAASAPQPAAPATAAHPVEGLASNGKPPYPRIALRRGEEGTALLGIVVTPDGRAQSVTVLRSSGAPDLDDAARDKVLDDWRFVPATQGGVPVMGRATVSMTFRIEQ